MGKFKLGHEVKAIGKIIQVDNSEVTEGLPYLVDFGCSPAWIGENNLELTQAPEPKENTQPITKENIEEVLKYNEIDLSNFIFRSDYIDIDTDTSRWDRYVHFENPKWIQHLEVEVGFKLKGLPIPKHEPHWVITKDGVEISKLHPQLLTNIGKDYFSTNSTMYSHAPIQYRGKESDFTILYQDGSVAYAKWVK